MLLYMKNLNKSIAGQLFPIFCSLLVKQNVKRQTLGLVHIFSNV